MDWELRDEEREIFDAISELASEIWQVTLSLKGKSTDPKMFSAMIFKRLWSNHRGFAALWNHGLYLEADIVLRSGLEAAICLAANFRLQKQFFRIIKQDAAFTLQGQIKLNRAANEPELVRQAETTLRDMLSDFGSEERPRKLDWQWLAEQGQVPQLYVFHRTLSGLSSHVTGLSILRGATGLQDSDPQEATRIARRMHLMMMAGATLQGTMFHSAMIGADDNIKQAMQLVHRLNTISETWPGAVPIDR